MTQALPGPRGSELIEALKQARVEFVAALPDIWTSHGFLWPLSKDPDIRLVRVCKEDEGVTICSALAFCDRRAILSMQDTGFLDSVNSIRGTGVNHNQPICMLVGLLGKEPDTAPQDSKRYDVRIVKGIIDAMGLDNICIDGPEDVALLVPAIDRAYATSRPMVAMIGRKVEI